MPTIKVAKPFTLQLSPPPADPPPTEIPHDGGEVPPGSPVLSGPTEKLFFPAPGEYEVDDDVAEHWYTKMHLEGYEEPPASTMAEVRTMLTTEQAQQAAEAKQAQDEARANQNQQRDDAERAQREAHETRDPNDPERDRTRVQREAQAPVKPSREA